MRLSPAIARIAGWPIEVAGELRSPCLASDVDLWLRDEEFIQQRAARLSDMLHAAVPRIRDKQVRAAVLHLRRSIHNSADPLPAPELHAALSSGELAASVIEELRTEAARRWSLLERRTALENAYTLAAEAELRALRAVADSPDFLKALYLSSPAAFEAWTREPEATRISKIHCRVSRYVMRAIGRCTPNSLWSGAALEAGGDSPGRGITIVPAARRVQLSPCLQLFLPALRAAHAGTREQVLPGTFSSAWDALECAAEQLPPPETAVWLTLIAELRTLASQLESSFSEISVADLRRLMDAARDRFNATANRYGVSRISTDAHVLIADTTAPFSFTLGEDVRRRLTRRLREYWQFDRYGCGEALARADRERAFGMINRGSRMCLSDWLDAPRRTAANGAPHGTDDTILQRWYEELERVHRNRTHRLRTGSGECAPLPQGSALVRLDLSGCDSELRIGAVTPDPCLFYSRFHRLFAADGRFARWYRAEFAAIERRAGSVRFADLAAYAPADANASARPRLHDWLIDLSRDLSLVSESWVESDPRGRARWIGSDGEAIVPMLHSAVALEDADPYAARLHQISHLLGRPSLMRPLPEFPREDSVWRHLPRICLGRDTVVSPERWTLPSEATAELGNSTGLERFIRWRRLVAACILPDAVYYKHYRAETELLMYTDSVLAVENLGWTVATYPAGIRIQEVFPSIENSWVRDGYGRHYAAEIAIAWAGDHEFWVEYAGATARAAAPVAPGVGCER